ncbi:M3 family metallopeptidase [Sphingomonadaceae bacterium OTU29LAMAA1]|nr:M3 family metallopeptidase [Sphingomonadaceae bacterium OTU29LAMAA1]
MTDLLCDVTRLPPFAAIVPDAIAPALDAVLRAHEATVARLKQAQPTAFADAWLPLERSTTAIQALWSSVSHLHAVADTAELRAAHAAGEARLVAATMAVQQDRALYDVLAVLAASADFATLPLADRGAVEHAIRDFTLSGVALEPDARARFSTISVELSELSNGFASAVLDATEAWTEHVTDAGLLAGLSEADRAMLAAAARARGLDGWVVTLHQPSVAAVLTFAEDRGLRARVYEAFGTRASDRGPDAGRFDNSDRIARIVALRREAAGLLGFADPVEWSLATKMAPNAGEVLAFLRNLAGRARAPAEREMADLRAFAAADLGIDDLQPWDVGFASDRLRRARHAIDEAEVRGYFPVDRVMAGWHSLLERLYGIRFVARDDVDLWHPDARYFDAIDADGTVFAGLYLDLYARPGKRGGAWVANARPRLDDGAAQSLPVAYLVCNFAPPSDTTPALLSHREVVTLLHETGHCLHNIFTRVDRPSIGGINGVEWDAVELPSQLMEDFAWDRGVLTGMSGHHPTSAPLPPDLFDRMIAARHFQSGMMLLRQVEFALFDLLFHLGTLGHDPITVLETVRDEIAVVRPPEWHRFPHAFTHIFAGGYASGYYSYLWAEVLSADGFGRFTEAGLVDRLTGEAFRDEVLARGATRSSADNFHAFRRRGPDLGALLARHGLA